MNTLTSPATGAAEAAPVTVEELQLAWQAVRAGAFRPQPQQGVTDDWPGDGGAAGLVGEPLVMVAGAHGWSGTSTTALLIADAAARRGVPVRLVDSAPPDRSGFAAAAATEHGLDQTRQWRQGSRGPVSVQRLAHGVNRPGAVPAPLDARDGTVTVVDSGWPVTDFLQHLEIGHWLGALIRSAPLVLTARATIPGLRHVEATVAALSAVRDPGSRVVLALLGPRTLPRLLRGSAGAAGAVQAAHRDEVLVTVPDRPAMARAGLTPAPLPRQLHSAADQLLGLTYPVEPVEPRPDQHPRKHRISRLNTHRKDDQR